MAGMPSAEEGASSTVQRIVHTLLDTVGIRFELLLVELKEERIHQLELAFLIAIALVCGLMVLLLATLILVVIFWDTHRLLVLSLLIAAYAGGTAAALLTLRSSMRNWRSFSATFEELKKDVECFKKPH
jgi:uncharacterized membrane protein YqjE